MNDNKKSMLQALVFLGLVIGCFVFLTCKIDQQNNAYWKEHKNKVDTAVHNCIHDGYNSNFCDAVAECMKDHTENYCRVLLD